VPISFQNAFALDLFINKSLSELTFLISWFWSRF